MMKPQIVCKFSSLNLDNPIKDQLVSKATRPDGAKNKPIPVNDSIIKEKINSEDNTALIIN